MSNRISGVQAVYEALASGRVALERIHIAREAHSPRLKDILELAREHGVPVRRDPRPVIDRLAEGDVHQGIVAFSSAASYSDFESLFVAGKPFIVVLDGVEDPHNFGAVVRTAEACGASGVIVPERHSAPLSATVAKASAGATAYVPIVRVRNIVNAVDELKHRGCWVAGVDMAGTAHWTDFDYTAPVALVLGGEHRGVRRLVREHCDVLVRLPMLGKIESLNISVAAAVVMYEVVRQRRQANKT